MLSVLTTTPLGTRVLSQERRTAASSTKSDMMRDFLFITEAKLQKIAVKKSFFGQNKEYFGVIG
jgi:hypothetical protein